jgi:hypothetical protein
MSLATRIEKLNFIVDELQIALHLARYAPDDFVARTLSRHVAIRANDFIDHTRNLRKPLNRAGFDTQEFNKIRKVYAEYFDEYFHVLRDKLGAHVQDFDFGQRIQLWNDIEVVKIEFFVDSAREIHEGLAPLSISGYVPHVKPAELTDVGLTSALESFKGSGEGRLWAELGLDPLAMTRPTATSTLGMSPVQSRAGQLVLIRRWIKPQRELISRVQSYKRVVRILKSRLITDIVSFFDGLVTRPVTADAPQRMDGLNTLLANMGQGPSAIDRFLDAFIWESQLRPGREVRDHFGAHLEIDEAVALSTLLNEIDSFDFQNFLAFFDRLAEVFEEVCYEVPFLRLYVADGHRLYGVMPVTSLATPFDRSPGQADDSRRSTPDYNDERAYQNNLRTWLQGDATSQGDARHYFWQAFLVSDAIEQIAEVEELGSGSRRTVHHLRKAHQFIAQALGSNESADVSLGILELLLQCRSGDPYVLSEVVMKWSGAAGERHEMEVCWCLGELASWPHKAVSEFLAKRAEMSQRWSVRFQAVLALFKIYMESEGLTRINKKIRIRTYSKDVAPLVLSMTEDQRLLCAIAFASQFCGPRLGTFAEPLAEDYGILQSEIDVLCKGELLVAICAPVAELLHKLMSTHDYVGVCLLLADQSKAANMGALADALLTFACAGCVVTAPHNQAIRHLAVCLLRKREFARALEIADQLAMRNPGDVTLQIFVAQVLAETPSTRNKALDRILMIRGQYKLTTEENDSLLQLELAAQSLAV